MIIFSLFPTSLGKDVSIINTSYEISKTEDMSDIFLFSYNDTDNKESIIFDYEPEEGKTYYGRVKCQLSTGPTAWGPVRPFEYDEDNVELHMSTPSVINTPILSTLFWRNQHPHSCFTVKTSPFEVIGNSKHIKTIWLITDIVKKEVVYHKESTFALTELKVDFLLQYKTAYSIQAIFVADNGAVSNRGSLNIATGNGLIPNFGSHVLSSKEDIVLMKENASKTNLQHEWYLYDENTSKLTSGSEELGTTTTFNVKKEYLKAGGLYLLQGKTKDDGEEYKYFIFRTVGDAIYGLPKPFPYALGKGVSEVNAETPNKTE